MSNKIAYLPWKFTHKQVTKNILDSATEDNLLTCCGRKMEQLYLGKLKNADFMFNLNLQNDLDLKNMERYKHKVKARACKFIDFFF